MAAELGICRSESGCFAAICDQEITVFAQGGGQEAGTLLLPAAAGQPPVTAAKPAMEQSVVGRTATVAAKSIPYISQSSTSTLKSLVSPAMHWLRLRPALCVHLRTKLRPSTCMYAEEHWSTHCDSQYVLWWPSWTNGGNKRVNYQKSTDCGRTVQIFFKRYPRHFDMLL